MEVWKTVSGYDDYEVSNLGQVRSRARIRRNRHGVCNWPAKYLKQRLDRYGYPTVCLYPEPMKRVQISVHVLVAKHFVEPFDGPEVAHEDHDKTNASAGNLSWVTHKQNMAMSVLAGVFHKATNPLRAKV